MHDEMPKVVPIAVRIVISVGMMIFQVSFFNKKDLADLTNSIMGDCATLETAFSLREEGEVYCVGSLYLVGEVKRLLAGGDQHA